MARPLSKVQRENATLSDPLRIHIRDHCGSEVRVWTDLMADYGSFSIVPIEKAQTLADLIHELNLGHIRIHHCDGIGECKCVHLHRGEKIKDLL